MPLTKPKRGRPIGSRTWAEDEVIYLDRVYSPLITPNPTLDNYWHANERYGYNEFMIKGQIEGLDLNAVWQLTLTPNAAGYASVGSIFTNNGHSYTAIQAVGIGATSILVTGPMIPAAGNLVYSTGAAGATMVIASAGFVNPAGQIWTFTVSSTPATVAGDVYKDPTSNNLFTVLQTQASASTVRCFGTNGGPTAASQTLAQVSGTGAASLVCTAAVGSNPQILIPAMTPIATAQGAEPPQLPQPCTIQVDDIQIWTDSTGLAGATSVFIADTTGLVVFANPTVANLGASVFVGRDQANMALNATGMGLGSTQNAGLAIYGNGVFTGAGTFYYQVMGHLEFAY